MTPFQELIERVRKGDQPTTAEIVAVVTTPEQADFLLAEQMREPFMNDVYGGTPDQQTLADAQKRAWNAENGYDENGKIVGPPIPE